MKSLRIKLAAVAVAIVALVAAPAAAFAYTPVAPGGTITVAPGTPTTVGISGFQDSETVTFTIDGPTSATLALVKTIVSGPTSPKAVSGGTAQVTVTLPSNASGTYTLTGTGTASGAKSVAVTPSGNGTLPATGVDSASLMGVWVGGGVLLLGGLAVTVFAVRRQRQDS
ncbi:LPXTG cell wall anchor domain-containing protein [Microbacterium sp. SORGH_AS_0888]|uniref:LPXTG cell wall anchor domain-containing protein n=1 Tax=Microbacterium sp. SORGH_AS_0888 TaxID=3041791 RepID=UPI0027802A3B|nr:LPXTG cell wall anchor domain-containing protein [Microbacterium sp. SORGH_AS_0888]MDQ1129371.1 LPXTG-motif cell wall-anchored protein [Microbacterium sp. SORGH_AS_0888]